MDAIGDEFFIVKELQTSTALYPRKLVHLCVLKTDDTRAIVQKLLEQQVTEISQVDVETLKTHLRVVKRPRNKDESKEFLDEKRIILAAWDLSPCNIVKTDSSIPETLPCIVQKYIRGGSLAEYFLRLEDSHTSDLIPTFTWHILTSLVQILNDLHGFGTDEAPDIQIQHGQIRPDNILIDLDETHGGFPRLKLIGFGLASLTIRNSPQITGNRNSLRKKDIMGVADIAEKIKSLQVHAHIHAMFAMIAMRLREKSDPTQFDLAQVLSLCKKMQTLAADEYYRHRGRAPSSPYWAIGYKDVDALELIRHLAIQERIKQNEAGGDMYAKT